MPTYEYRCKECGDEFDIVQAFSDDALTVCDKCGGPLRKVFGSVGIAFKGSGFYKNDSRSGGPKTSTTAKSDGSSTSSSDAGSSSSSDAGSSKSDTSTSKSDSSSSKSSSSPAKSDSPKSSSTGDKAKASS